MDLRLESSDADAPAGEHVRLVLRGFRNDLARHRVLPVLRERLGLRDDPVPPCTVSDAVDAAAGTRLAAELDALGAIVRVEPLGISPAPADATATETEDVSRAAFLAPDPAPPPRPSLAAALPSRNVRLVLICIFGLLGAVHLLRQRAALEAPPSEATTRLPAAVARAGGARAAGSRAAGARTADEARIAAQIRQHITRNDLPAAERALAEAPHADRDPALTALRAELLALRGDIDGARTTYEQSVQLGSEDPKVFLALAGLYRQQGRQDAAVDMLHRAQQHGASGREFEAMKHTVIAEQDAESAFDSQRSAHFTISFDAGEDHVAADIVTRHLEEAYLVVGHKLGRYPDHLTPVVLYAERDFQAVTHAPGWAGALYDGRIKVPVGGVRPDTPELARTLRHEYAHALITTISGGRCPTWLHEGVAMWAEETRPGEQEAWALGALQLQRRRMRLSELDGSLARLSPTQAAAAYAQSYLAVHHLVSRFGEHSLQRLLAAFASHPRAEDAFPAALPLELAQLQRELDERYGD